MLFAVVIVSCCLVVFLFLRTTARLEPTKPPAAEHVQLPMARTGNLDGVDTTSGSERRVAWRIVTVLTYVFNGTLILAVVALPIAFIYSLLTMGDDLDLKKGRVLRIRNRARLPEPATGDGWSAPEVVLERPPNHHERAVIGELWLLTARMEHASVAAFSKLGLHLAALGAPARLLAATHQAALDEIRHAQQCFAVVRAITGVPHSAGPIVGLDRERGSAIDLTRLAIGSLVDGCLGEGIASDVAGESAARSDEPAIRATLTTIAREEAGHAELAWDVLTWCLEQNDERVHRAVAARVEALDHELAPRLPAIEGVDAATLARYGVIDQSSLGAIASARIAAVQARARGLLGQRVRLAA